MEIICPAWYSGIDKLIGAIPALADQGVTAIEIGAVLPDCSERDSWAEVSKLISRLSSCGVRAHSVHAPHGLELDISSLNDQVHERGVDCLIASIEFANMLGASMVIVHAGDKLSGTLDGRLERARGVLREMSAVAKESGIMLALENLPPGYLGCTAKEIQSLLNGTDPDSIGVCFDSGHANLAGRFVEFAEALMPHAVAAHLHDNDGADDQHRLPGLGSIDWQAFSSAYHKTGASATIVLECKLPNGMLWAEAFQRLRKALE